MSGPKLNVAVISPCRAKWPTTIPSLRMNLLLLDRAQALYHGIDGRLSNFENPSARPSYPLLSGPRRPPRLNWPHSDPNPLRFLWSDLILSSCQIQLPSDTRPHPTPREADTRRASRVPVLSNEVPSPTGGQMTMMRFGRLCQPVMVRYDHSRSRFALVRPPLGMGQMVRAEGEAFGVDGAEASPASLAAVRVAVAA